MRIIPEHELAPDDEPCYDCNRIRVTPVTITDGNWRPDDWSIPPWVEEGSFEAGATSMLNALISLTGEGKQ